MCANIINHLGIPLAKNAKSAIGEDNQKGYFEDLDLARQQDCFLKQLNSHWGNTTPLTLDTNSVPAKRALDYIGNYLNQEFQHTDTLCIKDPRVCRLLPLWLIAAQNLNINVQTITLIRDPEQVCASLHRRDGMPLIQGKLLWIRYYLEAINSIIDKNNTTIFFDEVVRNPQIIKQSLEKLQVEHNNADPYSVITPGLINHKSISINDEHLPQLKNYRENKTALLSTLNQWQEDLANSISIEDYNNLVNYTYNILNDAADHARKIRNLEWTIKNKTDRSFIKKIIHRLCG